MTNPPSLGEVLANGREQHRFLGEPHVEVVETADLEASLHGVPVPCQECGGQGTRHRNRDMFPCPSCHGTRQESRECDGCGGSGGIYAKGFRMADCPKCGGSGRLPVLRGGLVERVLERYVEMVKPVDGVVPRWLDKTRFLEALRQELEGAP